MPHNGGRRPRPPIAATRARRPAPSTGDRARADATPVAVPTAPRTPLPRCRSVPDVPGSLPARSAARPRRATTGAAGADGPAHRRPAAPLDYLLGP